MSSLIFPQFAGLSIERTKTPEWKTIVHQSVNGKESRTSMMSSPIWNFTLSYETLRDSAISNELDTVLSFYNQVQGAYDTFLYLDPFDNLVSNQQIAIGNGMAKIFNLVRNIYSFIENISAVNGTPSIFLNGVLQTSGYTITNGLLTFTTAPASGVVISWSGSFYYRVRFADDTMDYEQFLYNMYSIKKITLRSVK